MISFGITEEQELIRDTVREFALEEMRKISRECDESSTTPDEFLAKTWELGLVNGAIPEEFGGGGLDRSPVTSALVLEEMGWGCAGLASSALAPALFVNALIDLGTAEQKAEYLPAFAGPEFKAASLAMHENTFTFDATNLQTVAEPKGSGFSISGTKRIVPLGDRAEFFLVVARSGARSGLADLEAFIVPRDAKGLTIAEEPEKLLGLRALPCARLELDGVEVPAAARLGGEAGIDGARLVNLCRVGGAAIALGLARGMYETARDYAKERVAFGQPIGQKQAIAFMLAEMQIEVNSMRWMLWKAASHLEQGLDATRATRLATSYISREAMKIADNGLQIFGGHGFIRDYPVEMWYRNARTVTALEAVASV